jgi:hypothetical protein
MNDQIVPDPCLSDISLSNPVSRTATTQSRPSWRLFTRTGNHSFRPLACPWSTLTLRRFKLLNESSRRDSFRYLIIFMGSSVLQLFSTCCQSFSICLFSSFAFSISTLDPPCSKTGLFHRFGESQSLRSGYWRCEG